MRQAYAHDAVVVLSAGDDEPAPGDDGAGLRLRVLFASDPAGEAEHAARLGGS